MKSFIIGNFSYRRNVSAAFSQQAAERLVRKIFAESRSLFTKSAESLNPMQCKKRGANVFPAIGAGIFSVQPFAANVRVT